MAKKQDKFLVKTLEVSDIEIILDRIQSFKQQEEHSADYDSIQIKIYSDGTMTISGDFTAHLCEEL